MNLRQPIAPSGMSIDDLRATMLSWSIDGSPPGQLDGYVHDSFFRFLHTWNLVKDATGKCLELGANPYFTSWLLKEFTDLDLTLANYFGPSHSPEPQELSWSSLNGQRIWTCEYDYFNLEDARFPYEDETFDVVLFCEIIEHLLIDPLHALREINRITKTGGVLVTTTPNVARLGNVLTLIEGGSIYDPYSGYGPYGRHDREYSLHELVRLLQFAGFAPIDTFTADAHHEDHSHRLGFGQAMELCRFREVDLGQYLFTSMRKVGVPKDGYPNALFRSFPDDQMVEW